jgi:hypothetical protein
VRRALLLAGIVVAVGAAIVAINRLVDPRNQFYSGAPLTAALESKCLLADDVVRTRSYPEFKRDLFGRRRRTAVVLGSNVTSARGVNLGFPGYGPGPLLDAMRFLAHAAPRGQFTVYLQTEFSWFDAQARLHAFHKPWTSTLRYLFSPWTLKSSLDLMRRSRTLAFTGWQKEQVGRACVVDRGSPYPAWRPDGTLVPAPAGEANATARRFAWRRLTPLDRALAIAQAQRWRVVGFSGPRAASPLWETYTRELNALFAKHGYRWRVRTMRR